jgi:hypothetical protein
MNTLEINNYMKNHKNFLGTFPCDKLNFHLPKFCGIIVNTDKSDEPGEHWVAIYRGDCAIYFDSFGLAPMQEEIIHYLDTVSPNGWVHNTIPFQSIYQDTCGMHCIYFLISMLKFNSFSEYCELFNDTTHNNDIMSKLLYKCTS